MTRSEHLEWCKQRALAYLDAGNSKEAFASMLSDMRKHPETADNLGLAFGVQLRITGNMSSSHDVRKWIDGFN